MEISTRQKIFLEKWPNIYADITFGITILYAVQIQLAALKKANQ